MIAHVPNLDAILKRHEIDPKFWPEFRAYLEEGSLPGKELQTRLDYLANYKAAEMKAMRNIGNPHTFPPADYRSPVPYESLLDDNASSVESESPASAGAPSAAR